MNTKVYGRTTDDLVLINRAMDEINEAFPNTFCSVSPPTQLIIAIWIDYLKINIQQVGISIQYLKYYLHSFIYYC